MDVEIIEAGAIAPAFFALSFCDDLLKLRSFLSLLQAISIL